MEKDAPDWTPGLAMGDPDIDEQHRMLFQMIRELDARMAGGEHRQAVLDALQGMLAYAATHFEDEEVLMEDAGWEGLARHEGLHAEFLWRAGGYESRVREDSATASREVLDYLLRWLVEHIHVEDRSFFQRA
ncbi:Bacteriohemerythrin [Fundidesulfovibrio magnetotacticus]|uniref:Bacteriohemerythrin n=1 Tax=Fundidesulfovibrio magnetotacticus TaxID=2730080 RepID=A0A6V8LSZ9_9BACT|nr:bacteriohemerythrin [Fundidesulfovibrio magnetotacticus]GFK92936.1 Bacteriohemerythrin [Fundidesulfovibrio magnetotacticus]